jgi:uncharacterized iron-regulated membrane protein
VRVPYATLRSITLPQHESDVYSITFDTPPTYTRPEGEFVIWIDPADGRILTVRDLSQLSAADDFVAWRLPLHNGDAFGSQGRWLVCLVGCAPAVLMTTGAWLYWRRIRHTRFSTGRMP